jgi:prepilin-type N-terminal cleavage/methylation domain-containing protein
MLKSKLKFPAKRQKVSAFSLQPSAFACAGFTMVEIAICLAIIGFALVAIIGVLPIGMNTQRDNREETIINQDATVFIEAIRNGSRGLDDLTNYVYAITNYWTQYASDGTVVQPGMNGYTYAGSTLNGAAMTPPFPLTNGLSIIGLLSTPEYTAPSGQPIPTLIYGGTSNHIVAYVRSLSGPAVEKPPQTNSTIQADAFGYRILCVNSPVAASPIIITNAWSPGSYSPGQVVFSDWYYWVANTYTTASDIPGLSPKWMKQGNYNLTAASILHELRLTFLWPQLPNGNVGPGRQTFRTMVSGQIAQINASGQWLYFYKPQTFANAQ